MAATTVKFVEATPAQLRAFGEQVLGLALNKSLNGPQLRAKILEVDASLAEKSISFDEPVTAEAPVGPTPAARGRGLQALGGGKDPVVTMFIPEQDNESGKRGVPVAVNGVQIILPRNVEFDIGYRYFEALNNAMKITYRAAEDGSLGEPSFTHEYPFQVRAMPPKAEVEAWAAGNVHFAA